MRFTASANGTAPYLEQPIEQAQVIPLRGQAMILSGYIRGSFTGNVAFNVLYSNSTDARASVSTSVTTSYSTTAITSSWVRFTATFTVPTDAVGLKIQVGASGIPVNNTQTMDWSNFQLELGSVATPFARAGGTIQGELAACQRYYYQSPQYFSGAGYAYNASNWRATFQYPVPMRVAPAASYVLANLRASAAAADFLATSASAIFTTNISNFITAGNGGGMTTGQGLIAFDVAGGAFVWSAEL
jgi:hypothetical protein